MATTAQEKDVVLTSFKALSRAHVIGKNDYLIIPLDMLEEENGFNQRDYNDPDVVAHIESLAQAYTAGNFVPWPIVRMEKHTGRILMVEGHCRRRAAKLAVSRGAKIERLNCIPFTGNDSERWALMANSSKGLPLKPVSLAITYLNMHRMGNPVADIARLVSHSVSHINDMLLLANANTDVHILVNSGAVKQTTAIQAVKQYGELAGEVLVKQQQLAQEQGKKRVTSGMLNKVWAPPAKVMQQIYASADPLVKSLGNDALNMVAGVDDDSIASLKGKEVTVDAYGLALLFKAVSSADEVRKRRGQRDQQNATKAKQTSVTE
ncbi:hypothetical protein [Comamonas testosteroni]|uniref:hypothetical protein n=1 Tax=Comamonas testosteroni TaxID=285 RepID=UPI0012D2D4F7|nr:hypothetical protein [Comamonas testosteroni]